MRETASTAATPTSALVVDWASAEVSDWRMAIRSASSLALRSARRGWSSMTVPTATAARYTSRSVALWASTSSVPVGGTNQYSRSVTLTSAAPSPAHPPSSLVTPSVARKYSVAGTASSRCGSR